MEQKFTLSIALIGTLVTLGINTLMRKFVSILKEVPTMIESLEISLKELITMNVYINITAFGGDICVEGHNPFSSNVVTSNG